MAPRVALITGITGQDGSYLAELLLDKGYEVHGLVRRSSSFNTARIDHIFDRVRLHYGDMTDASNLNAVVARVRPDEVYNLAAQSHVKVSFELPAYTAQSAGLGTLYLLEALRAAGLAGTARFYQASTSELYGRVRETPQSESTPFYPRSPYAVAKQFAHWTVVNYREAYGMHASCGVLFNHESERRGRTFVTRKITRGAAQCELDEDACLRLGNLDAVRDWGHARDYVEGMWRMLQQDAPDDYVLATGVPHTVREAVEIAFRTVRLPITWRGEGLDEVGEDPLGRVRVRVDPRYFRPTEVDALLGDASKARRVLGWAPAVDFRRMIVDMTLSDRRDLTKQRQQQQQLQR